MGSLYWQLNDVWPGPSWSSVDYFGRWKALQYHAKRFYAPVDVVPIRRNGTTNVFVVSDRTESFAAQLRTRLYDMDGKLLHESTKSVKADALSSTSAASLSDKDLLHAADPKHTVAVFELLEQGKPVARRLLYFGLAKTLALPKQPELQAQWLDDGRVLRISTKRLARAVWVDLGSVDAQLSNNAFDLLPGEHVDIAVLSKADLASLQAALKLTSLVDAVQPSGTETKP
jgi:beta-mannosidase